MTRNEVTTENAKHVAVLRRWRKSDYVRFWEMDAAIDAAIEYHEQRKRHAADNTFWHRFVKVHPYHVVIAVLWLLLAFILVWGAM